MKCVERSRLADEVDAILTSLVDLTGRQLEAFRNGDYAEFSRLDKKLEEAVGVKERSIGALRQHTQEHGC
jgi:hypothetical protein